jgi:hypothetical protein
LTTRGFAWLLGVSLVAGVLVVFRPSLDPVGLGLDRSHFYALQHATVRGWRWGTEFVSTHGPYSYVLDTMDVGNLPSRRVAFELALALGSGIMIALTARTIPGLRTGERLGLALFLAYALGLQTLEYRWFGLFWLCLLLGLHRSGWPGLMAVAAAGFLGGVYALIKLSLGGGALLTLAAGCLLTKTPLVAAARLLVAVGAWTAGLLAAWIEHFGDLAGLRSHLSLGWDIAAGYSSGMSLARPGWGTTGAAFLVFLALLTWGVKRGGSRRAALTLAAAVVPLFVVWKHALVRSGAGHVHLLLTFPLLVVAVLLGDAWPAWRRARVLPILGVAVCVLLLPWVLQPSRVHPRESLTEGLLRPLTESIAAIGRLADWDRHRATVAAQSAEALRPRILSDPERALIGDAPVDVYPFEISYVPANRLAWRSRPFPASYASYSPLLDDLNARVFASAERPAFVLWHTLPPEQREHRDGGGVLTLDGRHVLWDEPRTIRAILGAYDVRAVGPAAMILARRSAFRGTAAERLETVSVDWDAWTDAPAGDGILMADVVVARSWLSRGLRVLLREDPTYVALRFADGETREYRFSPDVAAHGLWISPFPVSADELASVLRGGPARRVTAIRFRGGLASALNPPLRVAWWRLRVSPPLGPG